MESSVLGLVKMLLRAFDGRECITVASCNYLELCLKVNAISLLERA